MSSYSGKEYFFCTGDDTRDFILDEKAMMKWKLSDKVNYQSLVSCHNDLHEGSPKSVAQLVEKVFISCVPNWLKKIEFSDKFARDSYLYNVWEGIDPIELGQWCFQMKKIGLLKESEDPPSEDSPIVFVCGRVLDFLSRLDYTPHKGPVRYRPAFQYTPLYDSLFLYAWYDQLEDASTHIKIQFRPRWKCIYPDNSSLSGIPQYIHVVPDVVFSSELDIGQWSSDIRTSLSRLRLECSPMAPQSQHEGKFEVPILIVEYAKDDEDDDSQTDRDHLVFSMRAVLEMYALLSLSHPIFGLLMVGSRALLLIGYLENGVMTFRTVIPHFQIKTFLLSNASDCLHIHQFLAKLPILSESLQSNFLNGPLAELPSDLSDNHRCVLPHSWDPQVREDPASHAVTYSRDSLNLWFASRGISVLKPPAYAFDAETAGWGQVQKIISLFCACSIPTSFSDKLRAECFTMLTSRDQVLWNELLKSIEMPTVNTISGLSKEESDGFAQHVARALCLTSMARAIDDTHPFSRSMWISLYDSLLFYPAWLDSNPFEGAPLTALVQASCWAVHRPIDLSVAVPADLQFKNIVVDASFEYAVEPLFADEIFADSSFEQRHEYVPQIPIRRFTRKYTAGFIDATYLPLIIVEHVKSYRGESDTDRREKHVAHLAVAMKSALALYKIHALPAAIVGLLCNRNIVTVTVGCFDEGQNRDIMIEVPSEILKYDIRDPMDALRLRLAVSNHRKIPKGLWEEIAQTGDVAEAARAFDERRYPPWKY